MQQLGELLQDNLTEADNSEMAQLQAEIQSVKNQLTQQQTAPADQTLYEDIRALRMDINRLLEERSAANSLARRLDVPQPVSVPTPSEIENRRQQLLLELQDLEYQNKQEPQQREPSEPQHLTRQEDAPRNNTPLRAKPESAHQPTQAEDERQGLLKRLQELELQAGSQQAAPDTQEGSERNYALENLPSRREQQVESLSRELEIVRRERDELASRRTNGHTRPRTKRPSRPNRPIRSQRVINISSSSSDDYVEEAAEYSGSEENDRTIPFFQREKGPRYPGLETIKPSDPTFDRVMNYRFYRLHNLRNSRSTSSTNETRKHMRALELTLKSRKFSGKDPILILNFLSRFVEEADTLRMTEGQAFVALPHFLANPAETQFLSSRNASTSGGVTSWPEAVQYLLETYATSSAIREATNKLQEIRQLAHENESDYATRLNDYAYRCGNVYDEAQKMTFFINGLNMSIRSIVARHRESQPRRSLTFHVLVLYARDEGEAIRAQQASQQHRKPPNRAVHWMEEGSTSKSSGKGREEHALIIPESDATSQLPSTLPSEPPPEREQLLALQTTRKPAHINYGDEHTTPNRVGWVERPPRKTKLICYQCYEVDDHISPNCTVKFSDFEIIILNYEKLSMEDRERVPDIAYRAAKHLRELRSNDRGPNAKTREDSKN